VHAFLAGVSHRELLFAGPTVSGALALESLAEAGQILISEATAAELEPGDVDETAGAGLRLKRAPRVPPTLVDLRTGRGQTDPHRGIPTLLREHLDGNLKDGEHRLAAVGFLKFGTTDQLLLARGPAALSAAFDELIARVQASCEDHDVTFLGTDVDRDGGKVLLATGTPSASPDDEDRLLLALRGVVDTTNVLPLRAGVHRGRIFSVDLGSARRRTFTVMGDAVNLAARVMAHAEWGQLLATQDVLARRRTEFDLVPLTPFAVKGKTQLVVAQSVGTARGRREETSELATPLIGREPEVAVIRDALAAAHRSEGRIIQLVGDPGIGKSKLVGAMTDVDHGLTRFTFEAGRYSLATPYFALRRGLRGAMGLHPDAPDDEIEAALRAIVERSAPELKPWLPLLGIPLGLDLPETLETGRLDPANRQANLHNAVVDLMQRVLSDPTLITIEDSHWLDAASCELLRSLLSGIEHRPWAVLVTRRNVTGGLELPEADVMTTVRLEPLSRAALVALAAATAQGAALPPGVIDDLVERSGGNPLFLQELVNAAMTGSLSELPDSIEAVVATTIDTLASEDRALLRHAAVLGSKFPAGVLASMLDVPEAHVDEDICRLEHFLLPDPGGMVRFRHVLLRDVAYEGLPFRARRALHERAGTILEHSSAHPEAFAELLSIHFHRAGRFHESWRYSRIAGERAQRNGAPVEAAAFYEHALEAARRIEDVVEDAKADIAERLGDTWELGGRYDAARKAYGHARRLTHNDPIRRGRLCRKIGWVRDHEGRYVEAARWFRRGLRELEPAADQSEAAGLRAQLTTASVSSKLRQGRYAGTIPMMEYSIREAERSGDRAALAYAYYVLDQVLVEEGRLTEAHYSELAVPIYEALGDERGAACAFNEQGNIAYWLGRWDASVGFYERAIESDRRAGALVNNAIYLNNIGEIRSDQGRLDEAEALLQDAYELWTGGGWRIGSGWALSNLGRVASRDGRMAVASERLRDAIDLFVEIGAEAMLIETEAREMERLVFAGEYEVALAMVEGLQGRARKLGLVQVMNMLDRLQGCAFCQAGDSRRGLALLERSIIDCRERGLDYEAAISLDVLAQVGEAIGRPGTDELAAQSAAILERLGVVRIAKVPLGGSRRELPSRA
jgi:class 3 adenylate cyclase/tetratricopeptide (TPR) repeat protein